jgi:hypothetical protein
MLWFRAWGCWMSAGQEVTCSGKCGAVLMGLGLGSGLAGCWVHIGGRTVSQRHCSSQFLRSKNNIYSLDTVDTRKASLSTEEESPLKNAIRVTFATQRP